MPTFTRLDYSPGSNWDSSNSWDSATTWPGSTSGDTAIWSRINGAMALGSTRTFTNLTVRFPVIMSGGTSDGSTVNMNIGMSDTTRPTLTLTAPVVYESYSATNVVGYGADFSRTLFASTLSTGGLPSASSAPTTAILNVARFTFSTASGVYGSIRKTGPGVLRLGGTSAQAPSSTSLNTISIEEGYLFSIVPNTTFNGVTVNIGNVGTLYSLAKAPQLGVSAGTVTGIYNFTGVGVLNSVTSSSMFPTASTTINLNSGSYVVLSSGTNNTTYARLTVQASATATVNASASDSNVLTIIRSFAGSSSTIRFDGHSSPSPDGSFPTPFPYVSFAPATSNTNVSPIFGTTSLNAYGSMTTPTDTWSGVVLRTRGAAWVGFQGKAAAVNSQTFTQTVLGEASDLISQSLLGIDLNAATSFFVNLGAISRLADVRGNTVGTVGFLSTVAASASNGFITTTTNTNGIMGGWAVTQSSTPTTLNTANAPDTWAVVNASSYITGLSSFYLTTVGGNTAANYTSTLNVQQISSQTFTASITVNSWLASTATSTFNLTGTLTLGSGGLLYRAISAGANYQLGNGQQSSNMTLRASSGPLYIHAGGSVQTGTPTGVTYLILPGIGAPASGTAALVLTGKVFPAAGVYWQRIRASSGMSSSMPTYISTVVDNQNGTNMGSPVILQSIWRSTNNAVQSQFGSQLGIVGIGGGFLNGFGALGTITVEAFGEPPALTFRRNIIPPISTSNANADTTVYWNEFRINSPQIDYRTGTITMAASVNAAVPRTLVISLMDYGNESVSAPNTQWATGSVVNFFSPLVLNTNSVFRLTGSSPATLNYYPQGITTNLYPVSFNLGFNTSVVFSSTATTSFSALNFIATSNQVGSAIITSDATATEFSSAADSKKELSLAQTTLSVTGSPLSALTRYFLSGLSTGVPLKVAWIRRGSVLNFGSQNQILGDASSYNIEGWGTLSTNGGTSSPNAPGYIVARNNTVFQAHPLTTDGSAAAYPLALSALQGRIEMGSGNTNNLVQFNSYGRSTLNVKASITQDATGSYAANYFGSNGAVFVGGTNTYTGSTLLTLTGTGVGNNIVVFSAAAVGGPTRTLIARGMNGQTPNTNTGIFLLWNDIQNPIQLRGVWFTFARPGTTGNLGSVYGFPNWTSTYNLSSSITTGNITEATTLPNAGFIIQSGVTLNFTGTLNSSGRSTSNTFAAARSINSQTTVNFSGTYAAGNSTGFNIFGTSYPIRIESGDIPGEYAKCLPVFNWAATTTVPNQGGGTISFSGGYHKLTQNEGIIRSGANFSASSNAVIDLNGYTQTLYFDGSSLSLLGGTTYLRFGGATLNLSLSASNTSYTFATGYGAIADGAGTGVLNLPTNNTNRNLSTSSTAGLIRYATINGVLRHTTGTGINLEGVVLTQLSSSLTGGSVTTGTYIVGNNNITTIDWWTNNTAATPGWVSNELQNTVTWSTFATPTAVGGGSGKITSTLIDFSLAPTNSTVLLIKPNTGVPFTTTNLTISAGQNLQIALNASQLRDVMSTDSYPLLWVTGSAPSGWENQFSFATDQNGSPRLTRTLFLDGNALKATLGVDRSVWTGVTDANWDTGTSGNWQLQSVPGTTNATFTTGDCVLFDDTATGSTTITAAASINPALINFNNTTKDYSITGGSIVANSATDTCSVIYKAGTGAVTWGVPNVTGSTTTRPGYGIYVTQGTFRHLINVADNFNSVFIGTGAKYVIAATDANITPAARSFYGSGGTLAIDPHLTGATAARTVNLSSLQWFNPPSLFSATLSFENTAGGATLNGSYAVTNLSSTHNFQSWITIPSGVSFITPTGNTYYPNSWTIAGAGFGVSTSTVDGSTGLTYYGYGALSLAVGTWLSGPQIILTEHTKISAVSSSAASGGSGWMPMYVGYLETTSATQNTAVISSDISGNYNLVIGLGSGTASAVVLTGNNSYNQTWVGDQYNASTPTTGAATALFLGANNTSGTLGSGPLFLCAGGTNGWSEFIYNRTDTYTMNVNVAAKIASASYGVGFSVDSGVLRVSGVTRNVNLVDEITARAGNVLIGRNAYSGNVSRTLEIDDFATLTAGNLIFNGSGAGGTGSNVNTAFGGSSQGNGGTLCGSGTVNVSNATLSLQTGIRVDAPSGSLIGGRYIAGFDATLNVLGNVYESQVSLGTYTLGVGTSLTINNNQGRISLSTFTLSFGSRLIYNGISGNHIQLNTASGSGLISSAIWNFSYTYLHMTFGSILPYSRIDTSGGPLIVDSNAVSAVTLQFLTDSIRSVANTAGTVTGPFGIQFTGTGASLTSVQFNTRYYGSAFTSVDSSYNAYQKARYVTSINTPLSGSLNNITFGSGCYTFGSYTHALTLAGNVIIPNYARVTLNGSTFRNSDMSGWCPFSLAAGGTLAGYGDIGALNVNTVNTSAGIEVSRLQPESSNPIGSTVIRCNGALTGTSTQITVVPSAFVRAPSGSPTGTFSMPVLMFQSTAMVAGNFTLSTLGTFVRNTALSIDTTPDAYYGLQSLKLTYTTQNSTWNGGGGQWDGNSSTQPFTGTANNGAAGDYVYFTGATSRTILIRNFPAPGYMYISAPTIFTPIQNPTYAVGFNPNGGGIICPGTIEIRANVSLLTKRNYITGDVKIYQNATFITTYRQAIYDAQSLQVVYGTFAPTDETSPNGVVFALATGNLVLEQLSVLEF